MQFKNPIVRGRRWLAIYLFCLTSLMLTLFSALYIYDPMMLFHKPFGRTVTLHNNMRFQASGIVRYLGYDSFILGSSMLENTSARYTSKLLDSNFANISISGSDYYERSFPMGLALEKGAKSIIYSLDSVYFNARTGNENTPVEMYSYLYTKGIERIMYYIQYDYLACLLTFSTDKACVGVNTSADMPNSWIGLKRHYRRFGGIDNWFASQHNNKQVRAVLHGIVGSVEQIRKGNGEPKVDNKTPKKLKSAISYIDEHILKYVRNNSETQFEFIFPPYSRIRFAEWHQGGGYRVAVHEAVVRYLSGEASKLDNMNVYGYEDQDFLDDIKNYKDTGHYDIWINELMIKSIAEGDNMLTNKNVDVYIKKARIRALSYDLFSIADKIKIYLENSK